ncbi:50S ribosomal protein L3 [bacterium]|nr:50S ribosomal protein L3 [bacterium]
MIGILGKKLGMTRIYDAAGSVIPVTVIQAGPCPVLQIKNVERDGYNALQLGFDEIPERKANKPMTGHFKRAGATPQRLVREVRIDSLDGFALGQQLDLSLFAIGEKVDVIGVSKGRGFAGPMKRHHSSRGPETHGSMYHRRAGSVGASADPSRVLKGKHMAGHMGAEQVTAQNLVVVRMDPTNNLLVVRGSVPGCNNGYVMIRKSKRASAGARK